MALDPADVLGEDLLEDLEVACLDAMNGDPPGPALAARLQRDCLALLRRRGLGTITVQAQSDRRGTTVTLGMPAPGATVREVKLTVG